MIVITPEPQADLEGFVAHLSHYDFIEARAVADAHGESVVEHLQGVLADHDGPLWGAWCPRSGDLLALWGCEPISENIAAPWFLSTAGAVREHRKDFIRLTAGYIEKMHAVAPFLMNLVHARNRVSQRWLRAIGFTVAHRPTEVIGGEPFTVFSKEKT